jgi:type III pantothenate kinase
MTQPLLAIDIGNTRVKFGLFPNAAECITKAQTAAFPLASPALPEPAEVASFDPAAADFAERLADWLAQLGPVHAVASSVNRTTAAVIEHLLAPQGIGPHWLKNTELPIDIRVDEPQRVGIDRLLSAVAANQLRRPNTPAIVVDLGTAIKVDLISAEGAFCGGAIAPGIRMSARALCEQTDALPESELVELNESPPSVGTNTHAAIRSGLYWGAVGAVRELIARHRDGLTAAPQVFLTGGAAPAVAKLLGSPEYSVRHVSDLVLRGIAVAAKANDQ